MTPDADATRGRRTPRRRGWYAGVVLAAAAVLAAVTACGNGGSGTGAQGEFRPVDQKGGTITVWVDSTRLPAAQYR
ncbi:hypothetical protein [Amycolatopsis sacchari]|uniref:hypothetical protein n=1 Tax=Amycolatopsis sacchari TaxID=115433 RepID=UPI003D752444